MPRRSFPASQQGQSVTARSYLAAFVSSPAPVFGSTIHYLLSGSCVSFMEYLLRSRTRSCPDKGTAYGSVTVRASWHQPHSAGSTAHPATGREASKPCAQCRNTIGPLYHTWHASEGRIVILSRERHSSGLSFHQTAGPAPAPPDRELRVPLEVARSRVPLQVILHDGRPPPPQRRAV